MKRHAVTFCLALVLAGLSASAGEVAILSVPPPAHFDTESVTNTLLLRPMMEQARIFRASVSLWATPSNNVEVAFGTTRGGDGVLAAGDEDFAFGWENGAWFFASPTNRLRSAVTNDAAQRTFSFQVRVREDGSPVALSVPDAATGVLLSDMTNAPPAWLFSRDWDAVRLTVRGTDERNESLSVRLDTDAGILIMR